MTTRERTGAPVSFLRLIGCAGELDTPLGTFLGVDISPWGSLQPVTGSFAQIAFEPGDDFVDADTDVDVFIMVPTPAAAGMASVGFLTLLGRRRRL